MMDGLFALIWLFVAIELAVVLPIAAFALVATRRDLRAIREEFEDAVARTLDLGNYPEISDEEGQG